MAPDSQHGVHLGPVGPRRAPCWPYETCYQGRYAECSVIIADGPFAEERTEVEHSCTLHSSQIPFQVKKLLHRDRCVHVIDVTEFVHYASTCSWEFCLRETLDEFENSFPFLPYIVTCTARDGVLLSILSGVLPRGLG